MMMFSIFINLSSSSSIITSGNETCPRPQQSAILVRLEPGTLRPKVITIAPVRPTKTGLRGTWWLSGRVSHSRVRGRGFETYLRHVVSLCKTLYSPKVLVIPGKQWLHPDMTEKLLNGTFNRNT